MKILNLSFLSFLLISVGLFSCKEDPVTPNDDDKKETVDSSSVYLINYGSYAKISGEISVVDEVNFVIDEDAIAAANGQKLGSSIQSGYINGDEMYLSGNAGDNITILDAKTLKVSHASITEKITKPRYFASDDENMYVSCWGVVNSGEWSVVPRSYIAVVDLATKTLTDSIALPAGPEGLAVVDGTLYAAMMSADSVAAINLDDYSDISYVKTNAVSQHIVVDSNNDLWVSQVSTYSQGAEPNEIGLVKIDTETNTVADFVNYEGISNSGYLEINKDKSKIYVMGAGGMDGGTAEVQVFDIATKSFADAPLVTGESFYGIGYSSATDYLYVMSYAYGGDNGTLYIYNAAGELQKELTVGVGPQHIVEF